MFQTVTLSVVDEPYLPKERKRRARSNKLVESFLRAWGWGASILYRFCLQLVTCGHSCFDQFAATLTIAIAAMFGYCFGSIISEKRAIFEPSSRAHNCSLPWFIGVCVCAKFFSHSDLFALAIESTTICAISCSLAGVQFKQDSVDVK
jgi:hypothetical protein